MNKIKIFCDEDEVQYSPRLVKEILRDYLKNSDEHLAVTRRKHSADIADNADEHSDDSLFKYVYPNTELGINLKLLTRKPGCMNVGELLTGAIVRDGELHYVFLENAMEKRYVPKRNPHVYRGVCVNVLRSKKGTLLLTFNRPQFNRNYTFDDFCREAAKELIMVSGLIEKKPTRE